MPLKCILFDLDGVVAHGERFSERFSRDHKVPMEKIMPFFEQEFSSCLIGKQDIKLVLSSYLDSWNWQQSVDALLAYWFHGEAHIDQRLMILIQELRALGIPCYIATNNEHHRVRFFLEQCAFDTLFDGVLSSAVLGAVKPHQDFYGKLFSFLALKHGVATHEVLFLDDDHRNVVGAQQFGFVVHHYEGFDGFEIELQKHFQ